MHHPTEDEVPDSEGSAPGASECGPRFPALLDEESEPDLRTVFGGLTSRSDALDAAVARIRLAGIDLTARELQCVERIRVVVAQLSATTLRGEAEAMLCDPAKRTNICSLLELMEGGRIEVRAAPLAGWAPDFTVFHRRGAPWSVVVGPHWFMRPYPHRGPALTSVHGPGDAKRAAERFAALWRDGHDISPAVLHVLTAARSRSRDRTRPGDREQERRGGALSGSDLSWAAGKREKTRMKRDPDP